VSSGAKSSAQPVSFAAAVFRLRVSRANIAAALLAGLALRLFFVVHFPFRAGDTKFYDELARNWLDHGVYGVFALGRLAPTDMRSPGYPAFLAGIYTLFGRTDTAVLVAQAIIDLMTCVLTALIASRLAPTAKRAAVATAALWIAALCPFTANYAAVMLTEVLATFFTTFALLIFVCLLDHPYIHDRDYPVTDSSLLSFASGACFGGVLVGLGTLVRPETPLVLVAAGFIFAIRFRNRADWSKLTLAAAWMAVGLLLPLMPWAVRNARTLGRIQFLAPRYAETEGDFIPQGFFAWTQTWMVRFEDAPLVPWRLGKAPIPVETLPYSAFDSAQERARVGELLSRYNSDLKLSPVLDREFASLARERTSRRPLRTCLFIPVERAWTMWFAPRVGWLRYSGEIWPPAEKWRDNPWDFGVTLGFGLLNLLYVSLLLLGGWRSRAQPAFALLIAFVAIRTAFLTQMQTVEPRYVSVCFPALLALCAQAWAVPQRHGSVGSDAALAQTDVAS
jgi:hypothetical protein